MPTVNHALIIATYALVSIGVGALARELRGAEPGVGAAVGSSLFLSALLIHGAILWAMDKLKLEKGLQSLRGSQALLLEEVEETRRRLEAAQDDQATETASRLRTLKAEMGVLESLVGQMAEKIASQEARLIQLMAATAPPLPKPVRDESHSDASFSGDASGADQAPSTMGETVRQAVLENRLDIYLQPIVSLPQRRVRFYECLTRLRTEEGALIGAAEFLEAAEQAALMPQIDNMLLFRSVQILRAREMRDRDVAVICNIAPASLADKHFFPQFLEFMDANREFARRLIFEFRQRDYVRFDAFEHDNLAQLAEMGFRFSLDNVDRLDLDIGRLADSHIRLLKIPARRLLAEAGRAGGPEVIAAWKDRLARRGVDLVADQIEEESMVAEVLDLEADFGQGFVFGSPRPADRIVSEAA